MVSIKAMFTASREKLLSETKSSPCHTIIIYEGREKLNDWISITIINL